LQSFDALKHCNFYALEKYLEIVAFHSFEPMVEGGKRWEKNSLQTMKA
jgi:hypothetical protein